MYHHGTCHTDSVFDGIIIHHIVVMPLTLNEIDTLVITLQILDVFYISIYHVVTGMRLNIYPKCKRLSIEMNFTCQYFRVSEVDTILSLHMYHCYIEFFPCIFKR